MGGVGNNRVCNESSRPVIQTARNRVGGLMNGQRGLIKNGGDYADVG